MVRTDFNTPSNVNGAALNLHGEAWHIQHTMVGISALPKYVKCLISEVIPYSPLKLVVLKNIKE